MTNITAKELREIVQGMDRPDAKPATISRGRKLMLKPHRFEYCELCETDTVICGQCGNNACNGGTGTVDGKPCELCEEAYVLFMKDKDEIPGWNNVEKKWEVLTAEEFASLFEQIGKDLASTRTVMPAKEVGEFEGLSPMPTPKGPISEMRENYKKNSNNE